MFSCAKYKFFMIFLLALLACSRKPIQSSGALPSLTSGHTRPEVIENHSIASVAQASTEALEEWNQKAGRPTFGLIPAFYQLPESMPAGAVSIQEGHVFGASYRSFWLANTGPKPFAILPASMEQAEVFSKVMNQMLESGIRFVEVSMADANRVLESERKVIEGQSAWFPGQQLPSGVDLLVSIQRGQGLYGPAFVGRVIRSKDGQLLALATQMDTGAYSLQPLLQQLVSDALRRLSHEEASR